MQTDKMWSMFKANGYDGTPKRLKDTIAQPKPGPSPPASNERFTQSKDGIDLLTINVWQLQALLENGSTTSVTLVELFLDQIERENLNGMQLLAMNSIAPRQSVLRLAKDLDGETSSKGSRGPLHGIPVILKDTYNSPSIGLDTTCGTTALKGVRAIEDSEIVQRIIKNGMIVLGKTNLSELSNFKGMFNTAGWSSVGGQAQSPCVRGGVVAGAMFLGHTTPSGSSSRSCTGVAAGFAPAAFGVETDGSVVQPASRAALFALKKTPGASKMSGIQPGNPDFDSLGVMSKSALDIVLLWNLILGLENPLPKDAIPVSWPGLKVGFVDVEKWQPADFVTEPNGDFRNQSIGETKAIAKRIEAAGARTRTNVELPQTPAAFDKIIGAKFASSMKHYFELFENSPVNDLSDLIRWNLDHAAEELPIEHPSQARLEAYAKMDMSNVEYDTVLGGVRRTIGGSVLNVMEENDVDVVFAPGDSRLCSVAASAGCPIANVSVGLCQLQRTSSWFRPHSTTRL